ncbi:MAG: AEC family transporter [Steroidobacteraceae bacterium]
MASFLLLLVCLVLGACVAHTARPPKDLARNLNWWVLHIALPAMVLHIIPELQFDSSLWFLSAAMWLVFFCGWCLFHWLGTRRNWSRSSMGAMALTASLSNTSFVGFPLIEALRGKQALAYAAIADQLGSFMAISIGGTVMVAVYTGGKADARSIARKVLLFPPFLALLVALLVALTPGWPIWVDDMLVRLGNTLAPLALFSVGLQLHLNAIKNQVGALLLGLTWKLGIAPALVLACGLLLHINQSVLTVALLEAAMAPMISAAILAEQNRLDPPLANMMVGLGILLSFITVPLWNLLV